MSESDKRESVTVSQNIEEKSIKQSKGSLISKNGSKDQPEKDSTRTGKNTSSNITTELESNRITELESHVTTKLSFKVRKKPKKEKFEKILHNPRQSVFFRVNEKILEKLEIELEIIRQANQEDILSSEKFEKKEKKLIKSMNDQDLAMDQYFTDLYYSTTEFLNSETTSLISEKFQKIELKLNDDYEQNLFLEDQMKVRDKSFIQQIVALRKDLMRNSTEEKEFQIIKKLNFRKRQKIREQLGYEDEKELKKLQNKKKKFEENQILKDEKIKEELKEAEKRARSMSFRRYKRRKKDILRQVETRIKKNEEKKVEEEEKKNRYKSEERKYISKVPLFEKRIKEFRNEKNQKIQEILEKRKLDLQFDVLNTVADHKNRYNILLKHRKDQELKK